MAYPKFAPGEQIRLTAVIVDTETNLPPSPLPTSVTMRVYNKDEVELIGITMASAGLATPDPGQLYKTIWQAPVDLLPGLIYLRTEWIFPDLSTDRTPMQPALQISDMIE
jgi:hypothetical protein